ncbi:MAG TPA: alpha/beta hydrolase [Solirubrobacteraceae bacterium]|nr:alpha/beta hydrolase [Solirubrobacteraceae bacterium]
MLFLGGFATSVRAFELTEFARTTRRRLHLRTISVERNGFGATPLDTTLGIDDAVEDMLTVLDLLGLDRVVVVAFSGGGPFAAAFAARVPERVISLHLAAAAAGSLIAESPGAAALAQQTAAFAADPAALWRFPDDSPVHQIPGFDRAAAAEGERALAPGGDGAAAMAHEWRLLCRAPPPRLGHLRAPAYLYHGTRDTTVPPAHTQAWHATLGGPVTLRLYDGEAHDVQYRHWDQILVDAAGRGSQTLICAQKAVLVSADEAEEAARGQATFGLCAWRPSPAQR